MSLNGLYSVPFIKVPHDGGLKRKAPLPIVKLDGRSKEKDTN